MVNLKCQNLKSNGMKKDFKHSGIWIRKGLDHSLEQRIWTNEDYNNKNNMNLSLNGMIMEWTKELMVLDQLVLEQHKE